MDVLPAGNQWQRSLMPLVGRMPELHLVGRGIDHELYKNTLTSTGWTGFTRLERGALFNGE